MPDPGDGIRFALSGRGGVLAGGGDQGPEQARVVPGLGMPLHREQERPGGESVSTASMVPSSAQAVAVRPWPSRSMAW